MNFKYYPTLVLVISVLLLILIVPSNAFSSSYDPAYTFQVKLGRITVSRKLYTSVPPSLYDYYHSQNHNVYGYGDYSKFVTPNAFESIAENIQNITRNRPYNSDEAFANAVLEIVHQIPYNKSKVKYPIETLVDNSGDCDGLSIIAASIMKAGGLDVVLLIYPISPVSHMNVGVHLSQEPVFHTRGINPTYYEYNGKKYYVAETTAKQDWKVGDQPQFYANTEPNIISLENCEKISPGEASSSLDSPLLSSSISLNLIPESSTVSEGGNVITISGSISPASRGQPVTLYITHEESSQYDIFRTVTTDQLGNYSLTWNFNATGTYIVQSSWNGVHNYAGSDSEKLTVHNGLNQLLNRYEIIESYWAGSKVIQTTTLNTAGQSILSNYGVIEFLEKNFTGTGVLLSSEFIILGNDENTSSEQTITILSYGQALMLLRSPETFASAIPGHTIIMPSYEQKLDNHLEFVLRQNGENSYSVSVRLLDYSDLSQIIDKSYPLFVNASEYVRENTWYNIETKIFENQIIANLFEENATHLSETIPIDNSTSTCEFRILMEYEPHSVIVFKNLKAESLNVEIPDQPTQLVEGSNPNILELLAPHIGIHLFELAIVLALAIPLLNYAKKRKKTGYSYNA